MPPRLLWLTSVSPCRSQSDLKRMSTSYENDRGAFFNAISAFDREGELVSSLRSY